MLSQVTPEDLHKYGLIPELVGRLPVIATVEALGEDDLVQILTEPRNALVKQYTRMFELDGVRLTFQDEALRAMAREAMERGTGARGLRSIMERVLGPAMFDVPSRKDVREVIVTRAAVTDGAAVEIVSAAERKSA